jgi:hypothetical protein
MSFDVLDLLEQSCGCDGVHKDENKNDVPHLNCQNSIWHVGICD